MLVKFSDLVFVVGAVPSMRVFFGDTEAEVSSLITTDTTSGQAEFVSPLYSDLGSVQVTIVIIDVKTLGSYDVVFDYEYTRDRFPSMI